MINTSIITHHRRNDINKYDPLHHLHVEGSFIIPYILKPSTWSKFEYTLSDIIKTLNDFSAFFLWQLGFMLGLSLPNSIWGSKNNDINMVTGKHTIITKLLVYIKKNHIVSNRINRTIQFQRAFLPFISIERGDYNIILKSYNLQNNSKSNIYDVFYYHNINFVAVNHKEKSIIGKIIISKSDYIQISEFLLGKHYIFLPDKIHTSNGIKFTFNQFIIIKF